MCFFSSCFHVFIAHSLHVAHGLQCMDWLAVSTLCCSTNVMGAYHELYANGHHTAFYVLSAVNIFMMLYTVRTTLQSLKDHHCSHDEAAGRSSHVWRTILVSCFACGLIISWLLHACLAPDPWSDRMQRSLKMILATYAAYGTVALNVLSIPERWFPGTFDIWGYSHQIFHFFVVVGIVLLWTAYEAYT